MDNVLLVKDIPVGAIIRNDRCSCELTFEGHSQESHLTKVFSDRTKRCGNNCFFEGTDGLWWYDHEQLNVFETIHMFIEEG